jgi:hypothetical protein
MRTRTIARVVFATLVVGSVVGFRASSVGASPARGCSGKASSFDNKGRALDKVTAPGAGGTTSDPFHVDVNGTISWSGSTTQTLKHGHYSVTVAGFDVASGAMKNDDGKRTWTGQENVAKRLDAIPVLGWLTKKLDPTATLKVNYAVTGASGGTCTGSAVLKIGDDPLFTPIWLLAVAMFLLAFWLLFWPRGFFGE